MELNGRILKNFDKYVGESAGSQERPRDAERAIVWQCAKTFLHPIARFAAHGIIKIAPMEENDLQAGGTRSPYKSFHKTRKGTMMNALPDGLVKWHRFVSEQDMQALAAALADDVVFRSPADEKPKEGKATAMLNLSSAARVLEDFTYHRQFVGDDAVVLEFSAHVGTLGVKGVEIIQFNAAGQIVDFEAMVRPASGLQALGAAVAQQLASANPPKIES